MLSTARALAPFAIGAALGGCSSLLPLHREAFVDDCVLAEFVVGPDGRLVLPATDESLVLRRLELAPPPLAERFAGSERWFVYPEGTTVDVRCTYRAYGKHGGPPPTPRELWPLAQSLRNCEQP